MSALSAQTLPARSAMGAVKAQSFAGQEYHQCAEHSDYLVEITTGIFKCTDYSAKVRRDGKVWKSIKFGKVSQVMSLEEQRGNRSIRC